MTPSLSSAAREFLATQIRSVFQLRVLLLLHRHQAQWWSARTAGSALRASPGAIAKVLEELGGRNLADVKIGERVLYRFAPVNQSVLPIIVELADAHDDALAIVEAAMTPALPSASDAAIERQPRRARNIV